MDLITGIASKVLGSASQEEEAAAGAPGSNTSPSAAKEKDAGAELLHACELSRDDMIRLSNSTEDRKKATIPLSTTATKDGKKITGVSKHDILKVQPMEWYEQLACVVFLAVGVPNGVIVVPVATFLIGRFVMGNATVAFQFLFAFVLLPLAVSPQKFVKSTLHSWLAVQILKYFSFRFIIEERPPIMPENQMSLPLPGRTPRPQILVAPPHGVFPYGNILSMLLWPQLTGHHFHGLAANSALRVPGFKQILRSLGVIDASRQSARHALERFPYTIGISTGGVAEVFETNGDDECILLKERIGLIKLAIRTGADLVPAYLFGNTKLLGCWAGEGVPGLHPFLEKISRKIGFALILFFGRWGLPIPYRVPILGVLGKPIPTFDIMCEEPTNEQIAAIQKLLIDEMEEIFEKYKALYGWDDKRLIIK